MGDQQKLQEAKAAIVAALETVMGPLSEKEKEEAVKFFQEIVESADNR